MCKLLDEVEKKLYIQGLAYVLGMNKQDPKQKKGIPFGADGRNGTERIGI